MLQEMGLLRKIDEGLVPAREVLLGLLPIATPESSLAPDLPITPAE